MKSLKGTQTERNILTAFAGESQARNRYDYFAGTPPLPVNITNILKCIPLLRISPTLKVFPKSPA